MAIQNTLIQSSQGVAVRSLTVQRNRNLSIMFRIPWCHPEGDL